jgi:hypothetical protein
VEQARRLGDLLGRPAAADALQRFPVHRLQPDLQLGESGAREARRVIRAQSLGANLREERERPAGVHLRQRVEQGHEPGTMVERRVEEHDLARTAIAQLRHERRSGSRLERAEDAAGARVEAEGAMRATAANRLDVSRSPRVDGNGAGQIRRRILVERECRVGWRPERRHPQRLAHRHSRQPSRIAFSEQGVHQVGEARFRLSGDGHVESALAEHEWIVGADLRSSHDYARAR